MKPATETAWSGVVREAEPLVHAWHRFPSNVSLRAEWGVTEADRPRLSVLDVSFSSSARLGGERLALRLSAGESIGPPIAELLVDERGRELTGPEERARLRRGLRQRVLFLFVGPDGRPGAADTWWSEDRLGPVTFSEKGPAFDLRPTSRVEPLGVGLLGSTDDETHRWGLLVRLFDVAETPGVGPAAPRLLQGGWEAQPGAVFAVDASGALGAVGESRRGVPMTVLFLYDTGTNFEPTGLFLREWGAGEQPLPGRAHVEALTADARRAALSADVIHSGVP